MISFIDTTLNFMVFLIICLHDCDDFQGVHTLQILGPEKISKLFQGRTRTLSSTILQGICIFPCCWLEKFCGCCLLRGCNLCYLYVSWFRKAWEKWKTWFASTWREEFKRTHRYICVHEQSFFLPILVIDGLPIFGEEKRGKDERHGYPITPRWPLPHC